LNATQDIVAKLWGLCHVLRDDGITYHQYVTELTFLLFLKMMKETGQEGQLPAGHRWDDLLGRQGLDQYNFYRSLLVYLGSHGSPRVQAIFANAATTLRQPKNLAKLTQDIDALDWYSARQEGLGDLYEGLLEKNANEKKSGAGQYFTPRPLIECMVELVKPQPGERVQDPALGTGGFLIAADRHVKAQTDDLFDLPQRLQDFQRREAFYGLELVPDAHRLALMNAMLHGVEGDWRLGDTLSNDGKALPAADVILTNPPFGTKKGGGLPTRDDFTFPTSNKQLCFVQHCYRGLVPGGRCAMVVPDNVLFEDGVGAEVRRDLMEKCDLHTLLRLPTGIFYAQGVKTNVLFFTKGKERDRGNTQAVWVYDLRTNMPSFGKTTPLTRGHFKEFEAAFGAEPKGKGKRTDQGEAGRFRRFSRRGPGRTAARLPGVGPGEPDPGELRPRRRGADGHPGGPARQEPQDEGAASPRGPGRTAARLPERQAGRSAHLGRDLGAGSARGADAPGRPRRCRYPLRRRGAGRPAVRRLPRPASHLPHPRRAGRHRSADAARTGRPFDADLDGPLLSPPAARPGRGGRETAPLPARESARSAGRSGDRDRPHPRAGLHRVCTNR
jgi:type I restriction enzyme M protein